MVTTAFAVVASEQRRRWFPLAIGLAVAVIASFAIDRQLAPAPMWLVGHARDTLAVPVYATAFMLVQPTMRVQRAAFEGLTIAFGWEVAQWAFPDAIGPYDPWDFLAYAIGALAWLTWLALCQVAHDAAEVER